MRLTVDTFYLSRQPTLLTLHLIHKHVLGIMLNYKAPVHVHVHYFLWFLKKTRLLYIIYFAEEK